MGVGQSRTYSVNHEWFPRQGGETAGLGHFSVVWHRGRKWSGCPGEVFCGLQGRAGISLGSTFYDMTTSVEKREPQKIFIRGLIELDLYFGKTIPWQSGLGFFERGRWEQSRPTECWSGFHSTEHLRMSWEEVTGEKGGKEEVRVTHKCKSTTRVGCAFIFPFDS